MPRRSSLKRLPAEVKARLDRLLADDEMTLEELVAWLDARGHPRSMSAVHRYRAKWARDADRLRQSREMIAGLKAELPEAAMQGQQGRVLVEMARTFVFDLLRKLDEEGRSLDTKGIQELGKGIAEMARALRFDQDFEERVDKMLDKAAEVAGTAARKAGISDEARRTIEEEILGLKR